VVPVADEEAQFVQFEALEHIENCADELGVDILEL
jgi:hypothetical protein